MPGGGKGKLKNARRGGTSAKGAQAAAATQVAELAWAGQHAEAIKRASTALGAARSAATKARLLQLRVESLIALGELERAANDAARLVDLASAAPTTLRIRALLSSAIVQLRRGQHDQAKKSANAAMRAARQSREPASEAEGLVRLA